MIQVSLHMSNSERELTISVSCPCLVFPVRRYRIEAARQKRAIARSVGDENYIPLAGKASSTAVIVADKAAPKAKVLVRRAFLLPGS